ncbi:hypothetical protein [Halostella salina]|uniref:hypothetical protein n=1 Tax=Halostella salina TaxID=1547897 RepID=UPI0013CE8E37|nr:hypothetical protein [Halostella salina]
MTTIATPRWTTARATSGASGYVEAASSTAAAGGGVAFADGCGMTRPRARTEPLAA